MTSIASGEGKSPSTLHIRFSREMGRPHKHLLKKFLLFTHLASSYWRDSKLIGRSLGGGCWKGALKGRWRGWGQPAHLKPSPTGSRQAPPHRLPPVPRHLRGQGKAFPLPLFPAVSPPTQRRVPHRPGWCRWGRGWRRWPAGSRGASCRSNWGYRWSPLLLRLGPRSDSTNRDLRDQVAENKPPRSPPASRRSRPPAPPAPRPPFPPRHSPPPLAPASRATAQARGRIKKQGQNRSAHARALTCAARALGDSRGRRRAAASHERGRSARADPEGQKNKRFRARAGCHGGCSAPLPCAGSSGPDLFQQRTENAPVRSRCGKQQVRKAAAASCSPSMSPVLKRPHSLQRPNERVFHCSAAELGLPAGWTLPAAGTEEQRQQACTHHAQNLTRCLHQH